MKKLKIEKVIFSSVEEIKEYYKELSRKVDNALLHYNTYNAKRAKIMIEQQRQLLKLLGE